MAVYTDGVHLVADTLDELHAFAVLVGLKRRWFQGRRHPHYDLTSRGKVQLALFKGAKMISTREAERISRLSRLRQMIHCLQS